MVFITGIFGLPSFSQDKTVVVKFITEVGDITAELYADKAPLTVANFLKYIDGGHFRGGSFYRTVRPENQGSNPVKIQVIQATIHPWRENDSFDPIEIERTNKTGLRHEDGTLSMARSEPNSATFSFFICIGLQPELDFGGHRNPDGQGFAAFGKVIEGMDVVRRINALHAEGQAIMPPARILNALRK